MLNKENKPFENKVKASFSQGPTIMSKHIKKIFLSMIFLMPVLGTAESLTMNLFGNVIQ